jgi:hypothetical protein
MMKRRLLLILVYVLLLPAAVVVVGKWHIDRDAGLHGGVNQGLMFWWGVGGVVALCWAALAAWVIERRMLGGRKMRSLRWEG